MIEKRSGLAVDLGLYGLSTAFALVTALTSSLAPHRAWGAIATYGYAAATLCVLVQFTWRRVATVPARAALAGLTWVATTLVPLVVLAVRGEAQEEVVVVEHAGERLVHTGTPYLTRDAIAALPEAERLLGYAPYQPGMSLFGLPRALAGTVWWADARVWFALVTAACLAAAVALVRTGAGPAGSGAGPAGHGAGPAGSGAGVDASGHDPAPAPAGGGIIGRDATPARTGGRNAALVRAVQAATVLPICALTLATGGDDLPVLALCLLALAFAARERLTAAGVAVGIAGALKLFAWPVALVLLALAATRGRRALVRYAAGAIGLPLLALVPAFAVDRSAFMENVVRYPLGRGLVPSTAASPFPGHLIATTLPGGRAIAAALLLAAGAAIGWWLLRRPPRDAAAAALLCAYGLTAAILLMPSTRFGYLLYPVAFLVWHPALRPAPITCPNLSRVGATRRKQGE
jgi:hypothetical protein